MSSESLHEDAGKLGPVQEGDRFLPGGEVEVTTCLDGPGGDDTCVGKTYSYDPHVAAKVVLVDDPGSTRGEVISTTLVSRSMTGWLPP